MVGAIAADHAGLELSVGEATVAGAVREATGVTRERLSALYRATGDLGDAAEKCRHTQVGATMIITLSGLCREQGLGNQGACWAKALR